MKRGEVILLDSSAWIEILGSGPLADKCERILKDAAEIIVPSLVLFEVYRKLASLQSEDLALSAITLLTRHRVTDLTQEIAITAADLSLSQKLAMADSLILAHAYAVPATLVTLDNDFSAIPDVKVIRKG